jgi:hypothetical protein
MTKTKNTTKSAAKKTKTATRSKTRPATRGDSSQAAVPSDIPDTADAIAASQGQNNERRLPPVGTVIVKRDRHGAVRCKCTVEEGGQIRYKGHLYSSISASALAAAKELGLENKTQNGWVFWGLSKPPRPAADRKDAATRAWARYLGHVTALVDKGVDDEKRADMLTMLSTHARAIQALHGRVV